MHLFRPQADAILSVVGTNRLFGLDVGSGRAYLSSLLEKYHTITLVDVANTHPLTEKATLCIARAQSLPFANRSFDFVYSTDMFEHLHEHDARRAAQELARVSRTFIFIEVSFAAHTRRWKTQLDSLHVTGADESFWKILFADELLGFTFQNRLTPKRINRKTGEVATGGLWCYEHQ